jgi:hypothetical protein
MGAHEALQVTEVSWSCTGFLLVSPLTIGHPFVVFTAMPPCRTYRKEDDQSPPHEQSR